MPYGRAILICLLILDKWVFITSTPSKQSANKSEKSHEHGVDLRSLHFPTEYHATGVLSLPTSNINEPFEVWHSQTYDKSRIDYYHGKLVTPLSFHSIAITFKSNFFTRWIPVWNDISITYWIVFVIFEKRWYLQSLSNWFTIKRYLHVPVL